MLAGTIARFDLRRHRDSIHALQPAQRLDLPPETNKEKRLCEKIENLVAKDHKSTQRSKVFGD